MPDDVVLYVTRYGYLAIFILVFMQEVGLPNLFPNELLLIFAGYLTFTRILYLPLVIISAWSADFIAANILYFLFYNAGAFILQKKPKWIPLSAKMIEKLSIKISNGGYVNVFIFRITPFTRGYTSVISGLTHIKPNIYLPIILYSGITWAAFWIVAGHFIGPSWVLLAQKPGSFKSIMLIVFGASILTSLLIYFFRNKHNNKTGLNETN